MIQLHIWDNLSGDVTEYKQICVCELNSSNLVSIEIQWKSKRKGDWYLAVKWSGKTSLEKDSA